MTLIRENNYIITNWYRKSLSSDRSLNFYSNHTIQLKRNIIFNLTDKAINLSDKRFHKDNLNKIRKILIDNNYEWSFINKNIATRLKILTASRENLHNIDNNNNQILDNNITDNTDYKTTIPIPHTDKHVFNRFKNRLKKYHVRIVPKIKKLLTPIIQLGKDKTLKMMTTNVVYKINCENWDATFIGQTKRRLSQRIYNHKVTRTNSAAAEHEDDNSHKFNFERTKILDREPKCYKRKISEMLFINKGGEKYLINMKDEVVKISPIYRQISKLL